MRLSICIPTYNFGTFIGATLDSLIPQVIDGVEVVIVDGASTDQTEDVVRRASRRLPGLTYYRRERNMGLDRDLAKTVELAKGDYCWLLSSDDVPTPGTVARILEELTLKCDVYLFNRVECDRDLNPIRARPWLHGMYQDRTFEWASPSGRFAYLNAAQSLGALFSYISSIVVSRGTWNAVALDEQVVGTNYAHVARLLSALKNGGTVRYIQDALIRCRGHNDSFATEGLVPRLLLDFRGYERVMQQVFPDDRKMQDLIMTVLRREHHWFMLARVRARVGAGAAEVVRWRELRGCLPRYGYGMMRLFAIDICPPVIRTLRRAKHAALSAQVAVGMKRGS